MADRWTLLLPVRLATPKGRLTSMDQAARAALALAMVRDVLLVAESSNAVEDVVLVGDDTARAALTDMTYVDDAGRGLNAEVAAAAAGRTRVAVLLPDVPAATVAQLDWALTVGAEHPRAFVADAEGVGTTLLMAQDGSTLEPAFGERSCAAHAASGAFAILDDVPGRLSGLRRDVDDEIGLWDAARLGVGPHTAELL